MLPTMPAYVIYHAPLCVQRMAGATADSEENWAPSIDAWPFDAAAFKAFCDELCAAPEAGGPAGAGGGADAAGDVAFFHHVVDYQPTQEALRRIFKANGHVKSVVQWSTSEAMVVVIQNMRHQSPADYDDVCAFMHREQGDVGTLPPLDSKLGATTKAVKRRTQRLLGGASKQLDDARVWARALSKVFGLREYRWFCARKLGGQSRIANQCANEHCLSPLPYV